MRRIGFVMLGLLVAVVGLWIAALVFLPDAPAGSSGAARTPLERLRLAVRWQPQPVDIGAGRGPAILLGMPVSGVARNALRDSWGEARDDGTRAHHGTDVMAPANTPVVAAAPGVVEKLWNSEAGGTTVYVRSPARTWTHYYAHLSGYAPGLHEGQTIAAGELLGYVGDTGNAGAGNYHLHFGLTRTDPAQHWYEGTDVDPFPYLAGKPLPG
ncbi:murein DD-endopeptidase MepM/ murein hydrolase activator NlpD [Sphingomonas sp. PvP055]|uniref:M23 family metallopeptidase n=1 Tax=Sphingomonas sp. PvP055 TaxID=3156391 RepID=UPI00339739B0